MRRDDPIREKIDARAVLEAIRSTANVAWNAFQAVNQDTRARVSSGIGPGTAPEEPQRRACARVSAPHGLALSDMYAGSPSRDRGRHAELRKLMDRRPGENAADIVLRGNEIWMVKTCRTGTIEASWRRARFFGRLEENFFGRDVKIGKDALHDHGSASIKYGRGAVLTVDLTNRCNMMCNPCFMDANQVGYVHELYFEDIKEILDHAVSFKPRRQISVQFSGGEPTISPYFLEATPTRRRSATSRSSAPRTASALPRSPSSRRPRTSGVEARTSSSTASATSTTPTGRRQPVRRQAAGDRQPPAAGIDITLVTTIVNAINNDMVGAIVGSPSGTSTRSSRRLPAGLLHRPRRGDRRRYALRQRYTLAHLAHDVKDQAGIGEPMRDWFPLSARARSPISRTCSAASRRSGARSSAGATRTAASRR